MYFKNSVMLIMTIMVLFLMYTIIPAIAQSKKAATSSDIRTLQKEVKRLQSELEACQNKNNVTTNTQRKDAIASLKAVRSAISAGADFKEFKKYQIESRIKVDALLNIPENRIIRDISDLYKDAVTFGITSFTGNIDESELQAAQTKYKSDEILIKSLEDMKGGEGYRSGLQYNLNKISANAISKILIIKADKNFSQLE